MTTSRLQIPRVAVLLALVAAMLSAGVVVNAQDDVPRFEPTDCAFDTPANRTVDCGFLIVPENRANPDNTNTIRLAVAIYRTDSDAPAADPVIYLEGGPGGSAVELSPLTIGAGFGPFVENRDLIFIDQRGIGLSEPSLFCQTYYDNYIDSLDEALTTGEETDLAYNSMLQCQDDFLAQGIDLSGYTSAQNAADIADLRVALGYDEVNILGISYGARLALTMMRDHPEGIRSVILGGTYPPQVNLFTETSENIDRVLSVLFDDCAADAACSAAFPDLETVFYDTVDSLNANPPTITVMDAFTGEEYQVVVTGDRFVGSVFLTLYSGQLLGFLPQTVYQVADGEYTFYAILQSLPITTEASVSRGMYYSVQCYEEVPFTSQEELDASGEALPGLESLFSVGDIGLLEFCDAWQSGEAEAFENEPVTSDIPTLILAGSYDPVTPPRWAQAAAETLPNSFYFENRGGSHDTALGRCATSIATAFLDDPTTEPDGSCLEQFGPPTFIAPPAGN